MSVGLIQGGNGGMGKAFIKYLLLNTKLNVIATSRSPSLLKESLELELEDIDHSRLSILEMNLLNEDSIASVAKNILDNHGKANLKLLINCSGVVNNLLLSLLSLRIHIHPLSQLHPDRSITQVDYNELLHQYQVSCFFILSLRLRLTNGHYHR
jgi:NAD(P)-dependent dehydrogenase (short-subunit alcohol dehydrogenase family)